MAGTFSRRIALSILSSLGLCFGANAEVCPSPDDLKKNGPPVGFSHHGNGTDKQDYSKVTGFDTARLDQESAVWFGEELAESDFLMCLYKATIFNEKERTRPFYILQTALRNGKVRVRSANTRWRGFCWGEDEGPPGCIAVCHFEEKECPFEFFLAH